MARNNYFNKGDPYSEWHRSLDNKLGYIDIDSVGICLKCKAPLYLAETTFDVNQTWKATTTTEALARLAGLPRDCPPAKLNAASRKVEEGEALR